MKAIGDIENVNLSTGERWQRLTGNGESIMRTCGCDRRLGPQPQTNEELVENDKRMVEIILAAQAKLKGRTMHYRNGREAKNGDKVVKLSFESGQIEAVGVLHNATPGNDYCNGSILPTLQPGVVGACLVDMIHADDLAAMLKEKGLEKRPPSK